jgi:hypothetical protein
MSTATPTLPKSLTDLELLHRWLEKQFLAGRHAEPLDEALERFAGYLEDLKALRATIDEARASSERGESVPWDPEEFRAELRRIRAAKGVAE